MKTVGCLYLFTKFTLNLTSIFERLEKWADFEETTLFL